MTQMHALPDSRDTSARPSVHLVSGALFGSCCFNCMHWIGYKKNMRAYCKRLNISGYDAPHGTSRCVLWEKRENARLPNTKAEPRAQRE